MNCYRCGTEIDHQWICPGCNADLSVFKKALVYSNLFYNEGLEKAGVRDLSGAIVSLKNSLKFNKYNIQARNLLGLVYYEMGEVVDALSEWVISSNYQPEDNLAVQYIEEIRYDRAHLKECNQTIKKYNQALLYCQQESRDLAIIQLKKVLSLNPKLVKAHQLMALLYIQEDKLEQAKKALRNAGKIDANNTLTLHYLKEVNHRLKMKNKDKKSKDDDLLSYKSGNEMIIMPKRFTEFSLGSALLYLVIGLAIGAAVIGFLVVPGVRKDAQKEVNQNLISANDTISSQSQTINRLEQQIAQLQQQIEDMNAAQEEEPEEVTSYELLILGYAAYGEEDFITAGEYLSMVDVDHISQEALEMFEPIWEEVAPVYYEDLYEKAYLYYDTANYKDAITGFAKIVAYDPDYSEGYATYYLAQSYRKNDNMDAAREYYQYIIDNYPNTELARTAENYINEE